MDDDLASLALNNRAPGEKGLILFEACKGSHRSLKIEHGLARTSAGSRKCLVQSKQGRGANDTTISLKRQSQLLLS